MKTQYGKIDVTQQLQARRGHRSAEPKPSASSDACRPKLYRMTRHTRKLVWLRWEGYGMEMRNLSLRMTWRVFWDYYIPFPKKDGLDEQLYIRRTDRFRRSN